MKNKVLLISLGNIYSTPYIRNYIGNNNNDYFLFYWDRENENLQKYENVILTKFSYIINEKDSKIKLITKKIIGYYNYIKSLKKYMKKNHFDKIIFLHNSISVMISYFIIKKYKFKYILDIRDYTFERNFVYYYLEKKVINNSYLTVISSPGYTKFLPSYNNYKIYHNYMYIETEYIEKKYTKNNKIIISNIGYIRFMNQNKKMIDIIGNDERFELRFIGKNANLLREYCLNKFVTNVVLIDKFDSSETLNFFLETDIVFNVYGNNDISLDYALSNKLYYAAQLNKPILVCHNTLMSEISEKFDFGITIDENGKNINDYIYNKYINIDYIKLKDGCNRFIMAIREENKKTQELIKEFLFK